MSGTICLPKGKVFDVADFRHIAAQNTHDGDDIKAPRVIKMAKVDVMVDGSAQILLLLIVDGL